MSIFTKVNDALNDLNRWHGGVWVQDPIKPAIPFIDPEYINDCLVDVESDFYYDVETNVDGVLAINIFFDALTSFGRIEEILKYNTDLVKVGRHIENVLEKIRLEYPEFTYHINHGVLINGKHGTQIRRVFDNILQF